MTSPRVEEVTPFRSERARSLRWKPSASIASPTRAAVATATPGSPLMTRETVFRLTPAREATSRIVGRVLRRALIRGGTTLSDNVVSEPYAGGPHVVKKLRLVCIAPTP